MGLNISNPYGSHALSSANIYEDNAKTDFFKNKLDSAANSGDDEKLKSACVEFESYFISTMLKEMRKTVDSQNTLIPKSQAEEMFQDMLDDEYSKNAATGSGIGLATYLYKQLSKTSKYNE